MNNNIPTTIYLYDRTFDGLLTAVFDAFVRKLFFFLKVFL